MYIWRAGNSTQRSCLCRKPSESITFKLFRSVIKQSRPEHYGVSMRATVVEMRVGLAMSL